MVTQAKRPRDPSKRPGKTYNLSIDNVRLTLKQLARLGEMGLHPNPERQMIGDRIRQLLLDRGKTSHELAEHCGIQSVAVQQWLVGATGLSVQSYMLTAEFLDVSVDYLLRGNGTIKTKTSSGTEPETRADG